MRMICLQPITALETSVKIQCHAISPITWLLLLWIAPCSCTLCGSRRGKLFFLMNWMDYVKSVKCNVRSTHANVRLFTMTLGLHFTCLTLNTGMLPSRGKMSQSILNCYVQYFVYLLDPKVFVSALGYNNLNQVPIMKNMNQTYKLNILSVINLQTNNHIISKAHFVISQPKKSMALP